MIGKFAAEALGEQFVVSMFTFLWGKIKSMLGGKIKSGIETKVEDAINMNTRVDENLFMRDFFEASMDDPKRKIILDGLKLVQKYDERHKTRVYQSFREIVVCKDEADPRPGVKIFEEMAKLCASKVEVFAFVQVSGAMQEELSFPALLHLVKVKMLPFLIKEFKDAYKSADSRCKAFAREIGKERRAEECQAKKIARMPNGFRKIVAHTIFTIKKYAID